LIEIASENETESPKQAAVQVEQTFEVSSQSTSQAQVNEEIIHAENEDYRLAEQIQRTMSESEIDNCVAHLNEETDRLLKEKRNVDRLTGSIEKYILDDAKVRFNFRFCLLWAILPIYTLKFSYCSNSSVCLTLRARQKLKPNAPL
jgi:hypothetical protein